MPKSGEVWCEGARICLNPFSSCFNLENARTFLDFAIEFTPQCAAPTLHRPRPRPTRRGEAHDGWRSGPHRYGDSFIEYLRLQTLVGAPPEQIERLWQLCINAEPNYGTLWFHCKTSVLHSTRQVLQAATRLLGSEIEHWRYVYDAASARAATPAFRAAAAETAASALQGGAEGGAAAAAAAAPLELPTGPGLESASASDFVTGSVPPPPAPP